MSLNLHPITAIQKTKNKRTVLPKTSLIQVFLDTESGHSADRTRSKLLPKFTNQQLINQFNLTSATTPPKITTNYNQTHDASNINQSITPTKPVERLPLLTSPSVIANQRSKPPVTTTTVAATASTKEKKFKELTRLCINDHSEFEENNTNPTENLNNINLNINQCLTNAAPLNNKNSNKQNLINYLARDFFLDCKQRLDLNTFKTLLTILGEFKNGSYSSEPAAENQRILLNTVHELIRGDTNLCNKFSAFLTCERALAYNLLTQAMQYEKCYEFFHKLDLLMPNRCSFKKLLQSTVVVAAGDLTTETDTLASKIEEIKTRIRTLTKNNPLINLELEYLFDQRFVNLEPVYERVSLASCELETEKLDRPGETDENDVKAFFNCEHIDLTQVSSVVASGVSKVKVNIAAKFNKFKPVAVAKCSKK